MKEALKEIKKAWGKELIVVNNKDYAGKVLILDRGAVSSVHRHEKDEVLLCIEGEVLLVVGEKAYWLKPYADPVHITPKSWHIFIGLEDSKLAEFSTEHKEEDVERRTESKAGGPGH